MLQLAGILPGRSVPNVVARLKVLANMITYRTDIPQEGRIRGSDGEVEMRVSTFPTYFGERAVIRMFGGVGPSTCGSTTWDCPTRSARRWPSS